VLAWSQEGAASPSPTNSGNSCWRLRSAHWRGRVFLAPVQPIEQAPREEDRDDGGVSEWTKHGRFYQPIIMSDASHSAYIDESMKRLPALAPKPSNRCRGGGQRQRNQQDKSKETHRNIAALGNILPNCRHIEGLVKPDVGGEVQANVKKSEETEHAAKTDELRHIEYFAKRSDAQRKNKKAQCPIASGMLNKFDRIGRDGAAQKGPRDKTNRGEAQQKHQNLGPFSG
jgi:hypothetical protein